MDKLQALVQRVISDDGQIKIKDFLMPKGPDGKTKGYAFVDFHTAADARSRLAKFQNFALTKKDIFKVTSFEEFSELQKIPPTYEPKEAKGYKAPENLQGWLLQERSLDGFDQYAIRFGEETQISWFGHPPEIDPAAHQKWLKMENIDWSPSGTYLVVYQKLGIQLWGGTSWTKQKTFRHDGVMMVQFSPCEKYLVTFSPELAEKDRPKQEPQGILIWDIQSGKCIRGFPNNTESPLFKWSFDDKYFSKIFKGLIYIYSTPSMTLAHVDASGTKVPLKLQGQARDHEWSPSDPYLCVYLPEFDNIPARVMLLDYPSLRNIGTQALVNVDGCHIHWHPQGDYLGVKVDRHGKTKKQSFTSFEFFRVREKSVPIEGLELKDSVYAFAWEPKGQGFALVHAESSAAQRNSVSFYSMADNKLALMKTLDKKQTSHIYWSTEGRYVVLAGLRSMNGVLEFYDAHELTSFCTEQHQNCTDLAWDPTGRYATTYVSAWRNKNENGYKIWSFRGKEQFMANKEPFYQFLWRPRPKNLLSKQKLDELQKPNVFKKFETKYKHADKDRDHRTRGAAAAVRLQRKQDYRDQENARMEQYKADAAWRKSVGIVDLRDEDFLVVEECVEEILDTKIEELTN